MGCAGYSGFLTVNLSAGERVCLYSGPMKHILFTPFIIAALTQIAGAQDRPEPRERPKVETTDPNDPEAVERIPGNRPAAQRGDMRFTLAPAGLVFASFDTDGDYAISQTELGNGITTAFARADSNGNGRLSLVELDRWRGGALGSLDKLPGNTQFDRNFDSAVTAREFTDVLSRIAKRLDRDKDGMLQFSELWEKARPTRRESQRETRRQIGDSPLERSQRRTRR